MPCAASTGRDRHEVTKSRRHEGTKLSRDPQLSGGDRFHKHRYADSRSRAAGRRDRDGAANFRRLPAACSCDTLAP